jgi:hypothetical protein
MKADFDHIFSVPKMLAALIAVGGVTLGLFAFDAERAIARLDEVATQAQAIHETTTVLVTRVDGLDTRVNGLSGQVTDHEKRITLVEAKDAK